MDDKLRPGYNKYIKRITDEKNELNDVESQSIITNVQKHYTVPADINNLLKVINGCLYEIEKVKNKASTITPPNKNLRGEGKKEHNYKRQWELIFGEYYNILKDLKIKLENIKKSFGRNIPFKDLVTFCDAWNEMTSLIDPENEVYKHINETLKYEDETPEEFKQACSKKISELTSPLRDTKYKKFVECLNKKAEKKDHTLTTCSI